MINTYDLFATRVVHTKVPIPIDIHKKIISFVEDKYKEENTVSCIKGFQFHEDFNGKKELDHVLNAYLKNFLYIKIAYSWLNVLHNQSYNKPHSHNGTDVQFAGVFYLSHENNNIHFAKDSETFEIKPKLFDLIVFPFHLLHYVLPEERVGKRICYAFNLEIIK